MTEIYGNTLYTGVTISATGSDPIKTPTGLLVTRSVETQAGWVGQVILDKVIIWESDPFTKKDRDGVQPETLAVRAANNQVIERLRSLFA